MLELITDDATFLSLREEWNELVLASAATIYQTHEWQSLWWKHFRTEGRRLLHILALRNAGTLVGIAPLFSENEPLGAITRRRTLRLLGSGTAFGRSLGLFLDNGPSDYLDIIVRPGFERQSCAAFHASLTGGETDDQALELLNVRPESHILSGLVPLYRNPAWQAAASRADSCARMDVPSSMDRFTASLRSSVRRRLAQARKAAAEGLFTIRDAVSEAGLRDALANLVRLHQRRWNRLGYPGLFADGRFLRFMGEVIPALNRQGMIWCKTAEAAGEIVAVRIVFVMNGTMYDYLSGFDDASAVSRRRPGLAILLAMLEEASSRGITVVDFLRGDEQYKTDFTGEERFNWNVSVSRRTGALRVRSSISRFARWAGLAGFLLNRERRLMAVQIREHGVAKFLPSYVRFRAPRLRRKAAGLLGAEASSTPIEEEQ